MNLKPKTVADVENTFDYLIGVVSLAQNGDREDLDNGAFKYALMILEAAEESMKELGMYEITLQSYSNAGRLALAGKFREASNLLVGNLRILKETCGTTESQHNIN